MIQPTSLSGEMYDGEETIYFCQAPKQLDGYIDSFSGNKASMHLPSMKMAWKSVQNLTVISGILLLSRSQSN